MLGKLLSGITLSKIWRSNGATNGGLVGGLVGYGKAEEWAHNLASLVVWLTTQEGTLSQMPEDIAAAYSGTVEGLVSSLVFLGLAVGGTLMGGIISAKREPK